MSKKPIYGNPLAPVSRQTARSMGWLEHEDREVVTRIIPNTIEVQKKTNNVQEYILCKLCGAKILKKRLLRHCNKVHLGARNGLKTLDRNLQKQEKKTKVSCLLCRPHNKSQVSQGLNVVNFERHITDHHKLDASTEMASLYYALPEMKTLPLKSTVQVAVEPAVKIIKSQEDGAVSYAKSGELLIGYGVGKNNKPIKIVKISNSGRLPKPRPK